MSFRLMLGIHTCFHYYYNVPISDQGSDRAAGAELQGKHQLPKGQHQRRV